MLAVPEGLIRIAVVSGDGRSSDRDTVTVSPPLRSDVLVGVRIIFAGPRSRSVMVMGSVFWVVSSSLAAVRMMVSSPSSTPSGIVPMVIQPWSSGRPQWTSTGCSQPTLGSGGHIE